MIKLLYITDFTERYPHEFIRGILDYSRQTERFIIYKMPVTLFKSVGTRKVAFWARQRKIHVVIGRFDCDADIPPFRQEGLVVFSQGFRHDLPGIANIVTDNYLVGRMAAEHFMAQDFRNFAYIGYRNAYWSVERLRGFRDHIRRTTPEQLIHLYENQDLTNRLDYDAKAIGDWLLSLPKPVSLFCCDDNEAMVVQDVCEMVGLLCPIDVAILGVDNDELICTMTTPPISSIQIDIHRGGLAVADQASRLVHDPESLPRDVILKPLNLVSRLSSMAISSSDQLVLRTIHFVLGHIEQRINVKDLLKALPISRRPLEIRFRKATGQSLYQYILTKRLEYFKQLLEETDLTIGAIAARMSEDDPKALSRRFKQIFGISPDDFRKRESN